MNYTSYSGLAKEQCERITDFLFECRTHDQLHNEYYLSSEYDYYPEMHTFYLAEENGEIAGFLMLYADNPDYAEISAAVHPKLRRKGIFSSLLSHAKQELIRFHYTSFQMKIEKAFPAREAFLSHYPAKYLHSEYLMIYRRENCMERSKKENFSVRPASPDDLEALTRIESQAFGDPPEVSSTYVRAAFDGKDTLLFTALFQERIIGCVSVDRSGTYQYLFALCIDSEYRHQGFGRAMLSDVLIQLSSSKQPIALGVDHDNLAALPLYQSCGFVPQTEIQYYEMPVSE